MASQKRYLISLDLDDTLLTDDKVISENTKRYLQNLIHQGHLIIINTGRPPKAFYRYYRELGLNTPYLALNGSIVANPMDTNFPTSEQVFYREDLIQLIQECGGIDSFHDLACGNDKELAFLHHRYEDFLRFETEGMKIYHQDFLSHLPQQAHFFYAQPKNKEIQSRLCSLLPQIPDAGVHFFEGDALIGELYHLSASKGKALAYLRDYYQIPPNQVIAFGDSSNDKEMLIESGVGVLMKNGDMSLKDCSDLLSVDDNNHDGVIKTLDLLLKQ